MDWVWVLSFTVLGNNPQHGQIAKFETKAACQTALEQKRTEFRDQNRELVGTCFLRRSVGKST